MSSEREVQEGTGYFGVYDQQCPMRCRLAADDSNPISQLPQNGEAVQRALYDVNFTAREVFACVAGNGF